MKDKIRPIYNELQGYLDQAPTERITSINESSTWQQLNQTIDELNSITNKSYDKFKANVLSRTLNDRYEEYVTTQSFRFKLGGLISRLHGEYFSDESPPFSSMPNTVITQNQVQNQMTYVQILLDIQSKIDEKLREFNIEGSKERTFLEKVKSSLSKVSNVLELIRLMLRTGKDVGLTLEDVSKLFP